MEKRSIFKKIFGVIVISLLLTSIIGTIAYASSLGRFTFDIREYIASDYRFSVNGNRDLTIRTYADTRSSSNTQQYRVAVKRRGAVFSSGNTGWLNADGYYRSHVISASNLTTGDHRVEVSRRLHLVGDHYARVVGEGTLSQ